MKKALFVVSVLSIVAVSCLAQTAEYGKIDFGNRNIPTSQPNSALPGYVPGGNGNGTYNVPIYQDDGSSKVGAGLLPGGVTVGLFETGATVPLVTSLLRWDTPANAAFFATATQTAITHSPVGSTPTLIVRAWQSVFGSFGAARSAGGQWREWYFTSRPLGGTLPDGSTIPTPSVTGWGPEDGGGVVMVQSITPLVARINSPTSGAVFASPATVTVVGEAVISMDWYFGLTNLSLFANETLIGSQSGSARLITARMPALAPGSYRLTVVADGFFTNGPNAGIAFSRTNYSPVNFTVVEPLEISVTPPQIVSGEFRFNYAANPGLKYVVKSSADLFDWQSIATNVPTANPATVSQPFDPAGARYYKVERLPNP